MRFAESPLCAPSMITHGLRFSISNRPGHFTVASPAPTCASVSSTPICAPQLLARQHRRRRVVELVPSRQRQLRRRTSRAASSAGTPAPPRSPTSASIWHAVATSMMRCAAFAPLSRGTRRAPTRAAARRRPCTRRDDARLLRRDRRDRVAQDRRVLQADRRQHDDVRRIGHPRVKHVRRIEQPTQPHLDDLHIDARVAKGHEAGRRQRVEGQQLPLRESAARRPPSPRRTSVIAAAKASRSIGCPSMRMRSLKRCRCGLT